MPPQAIARTICWTLLFFILFAPSVSAAGNCCFGGHESAAFPRLEVPAAPNEAVIQGKVMKYCIINSTLLKIEPEQTLYSLHVLIKSAQDMPGKSNFLKEKVGKVVKVYSKKPLSPQLFGKEIKARVEYSGDERGGKFWLKEILSLPIYSLFSELLPPHQAAAWWICCRRLQISSKNRV